MRDWLLVHFLAYTWVTNIGCAYQGLCPTNDCYLKISLASQEHSEEKAMFILMHFPIQGQLRLAMLGFWDQGSLSLYTCCFWGASDRLAPCSWCCLHLAFWHQWSHESSPLFWSSQLEFLAQLLWVAYTPLLHMLQSSFLDISKCGSIWGASAMLWI